MSTMRALGISERPAVGTLSRELDWLELPRPEPGPREVRLRTVATTINVDDQHLAEGTMFGGFPVTPRATARAPVVPGVDVAGVVDAVGRGVVGLAPGDRVFGIVSPSQREGAWAEYCVAKARDLHPVPEGMSFEQAASLGLAGMVACAVVEAAGDVEGKRCLVVGASGGIGSLVTKALSRLGAEVWGVASAANAELVRGHGAREAIDYAAAPFGEQLRERGVVFDRVVDCVGGRDTERQALSVLDRHGAFLTVCGPERYVGERKLTVWQLVVMVFYLLRRTLVSTLRGPRYRIVGPMAPDWDAIDRLLIAPNVLPVLDRVVPFDRNQVREAVAYVASHRARGKVVIAMPAPT